MVPEIVVTAGGGIRAGDVFYSQYNIGQPSDRPPVYINNSVATGITVQVVVHIDDASHTDEAILAGQKSAKALATITAAAKAASPTQDITLANGEHITAGQLLTYLEKTQFVITDHALPNNGGVGASDFAGTLGPKNTDYLDYSQFGSTGYGAASYGDTGMVGIMLHEISHMTAQGYAITSQEQTTYNREVAEKVSVRQPYQETDYWRDNEGFADTSAHSIANALNLDVTHYFDQASYDSLYTGAVTILADHGGW